MGVMKAKVPAALASGIACLLLGGGIGAVTMWAANKPDQQANAAPAEDGKGDANKGSKAGMPGMGGMGAPGGMGGKGGGKGGPGGFGGAKGPSSKAQLAQLVNKLDVLTGQSLHIDLTPDQKKQAKELLADLTAKDELSEEDAKKKLDALVALLEPNKKTLEEAGYGRPGGRSGEPPANPFKEGVGADHLKSLQATLAK